MITKQCKLCKHHVLTLQFNQQTIICSKCQYHVEMAYDQLTKCIKYYRYLNLDEIAEELGVAKKVLLVLQEDGRLQALHDQYHNNTCRSCKQPLHDPNRSLCSHCVLQTTKKTSVVQKRVNEQRRRAEVKKQIISSLSANRPNYSAS